MNFEFKTQKDLYIRIKPALHAKMEELKRLNYPKVKDIEIWKFLVETNWKKSKNLMLSDIVSDILNLDHEKFYQYLKKEK